MTHHGFDGLKDFTIFKSVNRKPIPSLTIVIESTNNLPNFGLMTKATYSNFACAWLDKKSTFVVLSVFVMRTSSSSLTRLIKVSYTFFKFLAFCSIIVPLNS